MIPKVAKKGRSFKGAGQYYLHDKGAASSERVAFTHTENLPTTDPGKALKCMAWTAMHQNDIKARAGGSGRGRKLSLPVYSYSLAWAPDQDPDRSEMIDAANESLKALGLDAHETLMVAHTDTAHPHIHVIVNRVHPETGIAAKLSKDRIKLSKWAEDYERRHGGIRVERRAENNARRRDGEFVKDASLNHHDWRRKRLAQSYAGDVRARKDLTKAQQDRRIDLYNRKEEVIVRERKAIRARSAMHWRVQYLHEARDLKKLKYRQQTSAARLKSLLGAQAAQILRAGDERRKGALSPYFTDTATTTLADNPRKVKDGKDRERRADQRERAADLEKLTGDPAALRREAQERTGKLAGIFSDHNARSKDDLHADARERNTRDRRDRATARRDADIDLKIALRKDDLVRLDQSDRNGRLSKSFTARALAPVPPIPAKLARKVAVLPGKDSIRAEFHEIQRQRSEAELLAIKHRQQRKKLGSVVRGKVRERIDEINALHKDQLDDLRKIEREERKALDAQISSGSQDRARALADGTLFHQHLKETRAALYGSMREAAEDITFPSRASETRVDRALREIEEDRRREKRRRKKRKKGKGKGRSIDDGPDFTP